ncbi:Uncharacterised protein [Achromobacter kerstersii]|jgi:hypothetical protein|uniref:Uncharacterized protein n=1 Tax=Achromobacter kerstersii TaxID=1353890 RepID=A0A6S7ACI2_9BURK|nr:hypothetical protein LMG3441_03204 [Achromobacter kerstersii]CUI33900.1 Uncharacterised protein [Achromobacter kerstersii]
MKANVLESGMQEVGMLAGKAGACMAGVGCSVGRQMRDTA